MSCVLKCPVVVSYTLYAPSVCNQHKAYQMKTIEHKRMNHQKFHHASWKGRFLNLFKNILLYVSFLVFGIILAESFVIMFYFTDTVGMHISICVSFVLTKIAFLLIGRKKISFTYLLSIKTWIQFLLYIAVVEILILLFFPLKSFIPENYLVKIGAIEYVNDETCPVQGLLELSDMYFGDNVNLSGVRVIYGGSPKTLSYINPNRSVVMVSNEVIYLAPGKCMSISTFIHEIAHVLQHQRNTLYGPEEVPKYAVWLYLQIFDSDRLYDYGGKEGLLIAQKNNKKILDFNLEQQADIIADYFKIRILKDSKSRGGEEFDAEYERLLRHFSSQMIYRDGDYLYP